MTVDRCHALETEVAALRTQLEAVTAELVEERAYSATLKRLVERAKVRIKELEHGGQRFSEQDLAGQPHPVAPSEDVAGAESARRFARKRRPRRRATDPGEPATDPGEPATENVYVFDDHDEAREAFDEFFSNPDPHLDKVRGWLLD